MRILWITNIIFPEAQRLLSGNGKLKASGGWMLGAADALVSEPNVKLTVATVAHQVKTLTCIKGDKITYYFLPFGKGNTKVNHDYESLWLKVKDLVNPDVVHLHGTEFSHGLSYIEVCGVNNVCVSIQGLVSAYYHYYYSGLSIFDIIKSTTLASLLRGGILRGYLDFKKRGEFEKEIISKVYHIIGRTSWDQERTWAINPNAYYHYGGETLRSVFYSGSIWEYKKCVRHSIFLSQANYPIKGLHMVLKAMPLVLYHYPDATLRIAGSDIIRSKGWLEKIRLSDYGNIIRKLIKKYNLENCVSFTGQLDEEGMKEEYLRSNVFVCPSSIENSPNSLGEAQILGVPVIASYVGGIPDMMKKDEEHLYRFEEVEMLAYKIVQLFNKEENVDTSSMRLEALQRHDPTQNTKSLLKIYSIIINNV